MYIPAGHLTVGDQSPHVPSQMVYEVQSSQLSLPQYTNSNPFAAVSSQSSQLSHLTDPPHAIYVPSVGPFQPFQSPQCPSATRVV